MPKESKMAKQLLVYESVVPVNSVSHGKMSFDPSNDYTFSNAVNAVPLMTVEFASAATEYAIVFAESNDEVMPVAILGLRNDQNLFLSADAQWRAKYLPAFIRRYPFVFSSSTDQQTLTLCIDETHPGLNSEGRGQRLFDDEGKATDYVQQVMNFLRDYQMQFERTRAFGKRLKELNLLEPMQAEVATPAGQKLALGSFFGISRNRIRTLSSESLSALLKADELELIYLHLYSLRNFNELKERFIETLPTELKQLATGAAATPAATTTTA